MEAGNKQLLFMILVTVTKNQYGNKVDNKDIFS